ncbi:hypothetical protein COLO4_22182 [Corchorus olitorius]|uniref:Protein kinase domain-containing protein n=1 Tax=Corchorus olitorius TaxID=93759 RepID=A0A1R3INL3_9ROSI|nr:hypothetical protein COLO4_22182 [Corchorus olitorius]
MIFYQASKLSFSITILFLIFQPNSFNAEINKCHGSCKTSNFSISLPYPFGFSAGCPIQLNCTDAGVTIGKFVVLNITSADIVIKLPAKCDREVASISVLFGENYALSSATSLLLQNCSKPLSGPCEIRPMFIEASLKLNSCASRSDNMSCFNGVAGEKLLSFDEINNSQCRFLFSATTIVARNSSVSLDLERVNLGWWHKGECNCDQNANCTKVMKGNSTVMGYRCSCKEGYEGDGFKEGGGCRRVPRCNFHHYMYGKCGGRGSERVVVPVAIGGVCLGFGLLFLIHKQYQFLVHKRLKKKFFESNGGLLLQQQISSDQGNIGKTKIFTLKELETATDHFNENRVLGKGGQGTVFQGKLVDRRIVAVKRSKLVDKDKIKEFVNEIVILSQIDHRNVVKLVGCCLETQVPLLVYEFVPNGTLFQYLHNQNSDQFPLTWEMRVRIASEAAGAISYLHSVASILIYHRDIKSTNILLDDKYRAKVSDFGTSKTIAIDQSHVTTLVYGTMGYLDPEYFQTSQFTEKSDVYSFGVVLAELLTGKSPVSLERSGEDRSLATYFVVSMEQDQLFDIIDVRLLDNCCSSEIIAVAGVAKKCLSLNGKDRPTMKEVAMELEKVQQLRKNMNAQHNSEEEIEYFGELDLLEISPI